MALSDQWQKKLDKAANRKRNPTDYVKTKKGTKVTQSTVGSIAADEANLQIIADNTQQVLAELPRAVAKALEEVGILAEGHVVGYMTENHIVDTGRLRNSITHAVDSDGDAVIVGTNVEYGPYVHNGTHGNPGRPFLTDPVQQHSSDYRDVFEKRMKGA